LFLFVARACIRALHERLETQRKPEGIMKAKKGAAKPVEIHQWDGLIHDLAGFRTASLHCGLKTAKEEPPDLVLLYAELPASAAGAFTLNRVCAAPVTLCRAHLKKNKNRARALIINAGNANACTGEQGKADAQRMAELVAEGLGCKRESSDARCRWKKLRLALNAQLALSKVRKTPAISRAAS
jgi:hypothetical protein